MCTEEHCVCLWMQKQCNSKSLLHTYFHVFTYLTWAKIFHLPALSDCCVFSFLHSFTFRWCHIAVILHSLFTGKFLSHLKRGAVTKASIILHCVFCLNVTQWLLWCCVHSHTTHRLAALQIVHDSSYPISTVREKNFVGFYYSTVEFFCSAQPHFWCCPLLIATTLQCVLTKYIQQHIYQSYFKHWISNDSSSNPALIVTVWVGASINKMKGCRKSHRTIHPPAF